MLQRIQSLFLGLIAISMVLFQFVNIWQKTSADGLEMVSLSAMQMVYTKSDIVISQTQTYAIAILAIVVALVASISIFSFRKRMLQLQLGLGLSLLIAALLGVIVYYSFEGQKLISTSNNGNFGLGLLIPTISLIFNSLANRFIRKDEEIVRSSDRMR